MSLTFLIDFIVKGKVLMPMINKKVFFSIVGYLLFFSTTSYANNTSTESDVISTASISTNTELEIIKDPISITESLIHTVVQIQIYHPDQQAALDKAIDYIQRMEQLFSTNIETSDVYKINQAAGKNPVKVSSETFELIQLALEYSVITEGKFDITIGAINQLWQIGSENARVPSQEEIQDALTKIDYRKVILDEENQTVMLQEEGMAIELGGISKGYISKGIRDYFKQGNITTAIINLGGNVVVMGTSTTNDQGWNVGVQDPDSTRGTVIGTQRVKDSSVITSGIYERYLEKDGKIYHHILDPKTGYPLDNDISSVTVFSDDPVQGDALSTSLFLMGIESGMQLVEQAEGIEAIFIDCNHQVYVSSGLKDSFSLTNKEYQIHE